MPHPFIWEWLCAWIALPARGGARSDSWRRGWHPCGSRLRHLRPSAIHRTDLLALGMHLTLPLLRPRSRPSRSVNACVSAALTLPIVPCLADDASSHSGKLGREIDLVRATSRKTGFHRKNIVMLRATTRCFPSHVRWGVLFQISVWLEIFDPVRTGLLKDLQCRHTCLVEEAAE